MDWPNELWIKLYVRDTADWISMSFDEQAVLLLLLRKADRSGVISFGSRGQAALPRILGHPGDAARIMAAVDGLRQIGSVTVCESHLCIPNYEAAQKARSSDRARKAAERARSEAAKRSNSGKEANNNVTRGHSESHGVTARHDEMRRDEMRLLNTTHTHAAAPPASVPEAPGVGVCDGGTPEPALGTRSRKAGKGSEWRQELLAIWAAYPRQEGKGAGLELLEQEIEASDDPRATLAAIRTAAASYAAMVHDEGRDRRMIKTFGFFAKHWEDYVDTVMAPKPKPVEPPAVVEEIPPEVREANREAAREAFASMVGGVFRGPGRV